MDPIPRSSFTSIQFMDEARLKAMETVMFQTARARETGIPDIDAITDEQVDFWNNTWKVYLITDILKAAMAKFRVYRDFFTCPHPPPSIAERSPISVIIGLYRLMLQNGDHICVFKMMLTEATVMYEQFGINDTLQLEQSMLAVDNDAVLVDYVVAMTLLARCTKFGNGWIGVARWCRAEIGLREQNGTWSGPTNKRGLSTATSQSLIVSMDGRSSSTPAGINPLRGGMVSSEGDDLIGPEPANLFGRKDGAEKLPLLPAKHRRGEDEEMSEVHERPDRPAKRFASRSLRKRTGRVEKFSTAKQKLNCFPTGKQDKAGYPDSIGKEYHERVPEIQGHLPPREISPFFPGEVDIEL